MDPTMPYYDPFNFSQPAAPQAPVPEQIAQFMATRGITPMQFTANPQAFLPQQPQQDQSLGQSLEPTPDASVPLPQPRPAGADAASAQASAPKQNSLADTLKGIKAPGAPDVVKPATPHPAVPAPHGTIKGGQLLALLSALGSQVPATKVPLPLGTVLGGRYG